jgi:hypothetical protein
MAPERRRPTDSTVAKIVPADRFEMNSEHDADATAEFADAAAGTGFGHSQGDPSCIRSNDFFLPVLRSAAKAGQRRTNRLIAHPRHRQNLGRDV